MGGISFLIGMGALIFADDTITKLAGGFLPVVLAIILLVIGEIIGVAFAIEDNTKRIADFCEKMHDLKSLVTQSNALIEQSNKILAEYTLTKNNSLIEVAQPKPQSSFDEGDQSRKKMLSPFTFASEIENAKGLS